MTCATPVALFVFNRPETTRRIFQAIAAVRPSRLLLIADGPRADRPNEAEACRVVRDLVTKIYWPCEVSSDFSQSNLGCGSRLASGLDWVFSQVEEAIILEDDCLPDPTFFRFCDEMLARFRGDSRVAAVSGTNLVPMRSDNDASYWFSELGGNWGWATWREEWARFDRGLHDWPALRREGMLYKVFRSREVADYWAAVFDAIVEGRLPNEWDYQWFFARLRNHSLTVHPRLNLVANIGFGGEDATHTVAPNPKLAASLHALEFPMRHPLSMVPDQKKDEAFLRIILGTPTQRVGRSLRGLARRWQTRTRARPEPLQRAVQGADQP